MLTSIIYPFKFKMSKEFFLDLMKNSGRYSEILNLKATPEDITFSETGQIGNSEIIYKKKDLPELTFDKKRLILELEDKNHDRDILDKIKKDLDTKVSKGAYSLVFINVLKIFCSLLDLNDTLSFSIKSDHPLKVEIIFKKLEDTDFIYFLTFRSEEAEFEEDDF